MPAIFHCLGPIYHFIHHRDGASGPWLFLGTAETSPNEETTHGYLPVMNDIGGRTFPMEQVRDRAQSIITTTINRLNYTTYNILRRTLPVGGGSPAEYRDTFTDHGGPVIGSDDFELAMVYSFGSVAGLNASDTPKGRVYKSVIPKKFVETSVGTRVNTVSILFEANGVYMPSDRSFRLFDENPALFSGAVPE